MEYFKTPDGRKWEMTFSDAFEGTELDLTKWKEVLRSDGRTQAGTGMTPTAIWTERAIWC